ncbi:MAG TPA: PEP-CTERM sorting domain-containing protein [Tepidisphaeraceae bacterium]|jgi:hypothetical protein|nr:PEP-CTERM sorting domain-containing protein [Tepidisphaeraceae bacterium]
MRASFGLALGGLMGMSMLGIAKASPEITGFDSTTDTVNGGGASIVTGGNTTNSILQLTNGTATGNGNEGTSSYNTTAQSVGLAFTANFTYTVLAGTSPVADGFSFILQNQSATVGGQNGGSGNSGRGLPVTIANGTNSNGVVAVGVENFSGSGGAGLYLNENGTVNPSPTNPGYFTQASTNGGTTKTGNVDFSTFNNPINVTITYDGANSLSFSATDGASDVFSHTYMLTDTVANELAANTSTALANGTAFVGFGGGSGGLQETQQISDFTFSTSAVPEPASLGLLTLGCIGLLARRRRA